jgi:hypothetical protein
LKPGAGLVNLRRAGNIVMQSSDYPFRFEFRVRLYRKGNPGKTYQRSLTVDADDEHFARRGMMERALDDGFFIKEIIGVEQTKL